MNGCPDQHHSSLSSSPPPDDSNHSLGFSFQPNPNPLEHNYLVLKLVLGHVGKAAGRRVPTDLFNCRLVNHAWNRVAVAQLEQQHRYALELDFQKLVCYTELLRRTDEELSKSAGQQLASLRLSLNLATSSSGSNSSSTLLSEEEPAPAAAAAEPAEQPFSISNIAYTIKLLTTYPHLRVAFLKYTAQQASCFTSSSSGQLTSMNDQNLELIDFLRLSSTTLAGITMCFHHQQSTEGERLEEELELRSQHHPDQLFDFQLNYTSITFPALTSFHYQQQGKGSRRRRLLQEGQNLTQHVVHIIQNAPKLTKLGLAICGGSPKETANCLQSILQHCSTRLQHLEFVEGGYGGIWKTLTELTFPKLKLLKIVNGLFASNTWVAQFLENCCPALGELHVNWVGSSCEDRAFAAIEAADGREAKLLGRSPFPLLPTITHFEFKAHFSKGIWSSYLQHVASTFTTLMSSLPSLRSVAIDLETLYMVGAGAPGTIQEFQTFPQVKSLEIQVHLPKKSTYDLMDISEDIYHHSFASIKELILKLDPEVANMSEHSALTFENISLQTNLQFLISHPGIQHLEIHNYGYDWMRLENSGFLNLQDNVVYEQLISLKLFPPTPAAAAAVGGGGGPKVSFMKLFSRLPSLQFLQLGKEQVSQLELQVVRNVMTRCEKPAGNYITYSDIVEDND